MGNTTSATHPGASPGQLLVHIPHVLERILRSADRATLATCLRVNTRLFHAAGAFLYHTVRVDTDASISALFLGAVCIHRARRRPGHCARCEEWRMCTYPTSLKGELLAKVRVLSLGSHSTSACLSYGAAASLLTRLEVLRLVRAPKDVRSLARACRYHRVCRFLTSTKPAKLVIRNASAHSMRKFLHGLPGHTPAEVVWVVSRSRRRFPRDKGFPGRSCGPGGSVKIVFDDSWELWREEDLAVIDRDTPPQVSSEFLHPADVVSALLAARNVRPACDVTVYGLESVLLTDHWRIEPTEGDYARWLRSVPMDIVRDALPWPGARSSSEHVEGAEILFKTLEEYASGAGRRWELDDGWDELR
ncbi:hypothetical protein Q8F55_004844 [Vanrija albida]|uniref:F-box domain-containing protein n=1 Tax=Vanrija albida TaxID=181172 RepID=A0ABR3Q0G2_9TREE